MTPEDIINAALDYERKYYIAPNILFLGRDTYIDILKSTENHNNYRALQSRLILSKKVQIIILEIPEYFQPRHSRALGGMNEYRWRKHTIAPIGSSSEVAMPPPPLIIEEVPQLEIDAYKDAYKLV